MNKITGFFFKSNQVKSNKNILSKENEKIKEISSSTIGQSSKTEVKSDLGKKLLENKKEELINLKNAAIGTKDITKQIKPINLIREIAVMKDTPVAARQFAVDCLKEIAQKTQDDLKQDELNIKENYALGILATLTEESEENKELRDYALKTMDNIKETSRKKIIQKKVDNATELLNSFKETFIKAKQAFLQSKKENNVDQAKQNYELLMDTADAMKIVVFDTNQPREVNILAINFIKDMVVETADFYLFELLFSIEKKAMDKEDTGDKTTKEILYYVRSAIQKIHFTTESTDLAEDAINSGAEEKGLKYLQERATRGDERALQYLCILLERKVKKNEEYFSKYLDTLEEIVIQASQNDQGEILQYIQIYLTTRAVPDELQAKLKNIQKLISSALNSFYIDGQGAVLKSSIREMIKQDAEGSFAKLGKFKTEESVVVKERSTDEKNFISDENIDIPYQSYKDQARDFRVAVNDQMHKEVVAEERVYQTTLDLVKLFNKEMNDSSSNLMESIGYLYTKRLLGFIHQGIVGDASTYLKNKYSAFTSDQIIVKQAAAHQFNVKIEKNNVIVTYETILKINQYNELKSDIVAEGYIKVKKEVIIPLSDLKDILDDKVLKEKASSEILPNLIVKEEYSKKFDSLDDLMKAEKNMV